eukprot:1964112-Amphidinium_carterae.1
MVKKNRKWRKGSSWLESALPHSRTPDLLQTDESQTRAVTVRQFLDAQGWINERLIWHQHVLHPDLLFKDYKLDFLVLFVLPDTSDTDAMSVIRPFRDCRASDT